MLTLEAFQIFHFGIPLFPPLSLNINAGEIASIMGPSGCGKSTLLSAICGNLAEVFTLKGNVLLKDNSVLTLPMEKRRIGIQFQDDLLFPHMNISENLAFALPAQIGKKERREKIAEALEKADLLNFEKRDHNSLQKLLF